MDHLSANSLVHALENRSILITGATGFLAKIFIEKILRVQPNVKKLYLLLRAADCNSAMQRFNSEIIGKELFRVAREKYGSDWSSLIAQKIRVVAGDITNSENLGVLDPTLLEEMWKEVDVVVNLAATTNFDERYDVSISVNTMGAKHVLDFAKRCGNIKVLLHVSTAYVSGETEGVIREIPYSMAETLNGTVGLDIDHENKIVDENLNELRARNASEQEIKLAMKDLGIQRAIKFGWPNTYVFTKAMGEMLLGDLKQNISLIIFRPTDVTSTYQEPFPGWIEGLKTIDSIIFGYSRGRITCLPGDPTSISDIIPADMVVNAMIVAMLLHANEQKVYHVGSSLVNPVTFSSLQDYVQRYFTEHPSVDKKGNLVKVGKITILRTMDSFHNYMNLHYLLPLKGLKILNTAFCQHFDGLYNDLHRKVKYAKRMIDLYEPYLFFKGIYDDTNTEVLRHTIRENGDEKLFQFDSRDIHWEDYYMNIHIPGLIKYVFK